MFVTPFLSEISFSVSTWICAGLRTNPSTLMPRWTRGRTN